MIFFLFILGGCNALQVSSQANQTETPIPSPVVTTTLPPDQCVDMDGNLYKYGDLFGALVVYRFESYWLLNLYDGTFREITTDIRLKPDVSPDGTKISVYKFGIDVSFIDMNGNILSSFPWYEKWNNANFYWLDENSLAIFVLSLDSLDILNINTGEIENINFPYSDEVYAKGGVADFRKGFVRYSPTVESVIYAVSPSALVLRNNEFRIWSSNTIAWARNTGTNLSEPVWSPEGNLVALSQEDDRGDLSTVENIFIVSTTGEDIRITDLKKKYNNPFRLYISNITWSSDGEKIAFVANVTQYAGSKTLSQLLVLDRLSGTLEDYCNPDTDNPYSSGSFSYIWSPDSKYIATETTIVDLENRQIYKIPDVLIVDWVGEGKTP